MNQPNTQPLSAFDLLLYGLVVFAWSTSWIAIKMQLGAVPPDVSIFWRFVISALCMMGIARWRGDRLSYGWRAHLRFVALGATLFSGNFILMYSGSAYIPSGLVSVVFSLASVINLVLAAVFFHQRPTPRHLAGALIGVAGVGLMFTPQLMDARLGASALWGLACCIGGTLFFCVGNQVSAESQRSGLAVIPSAAWGMVYGMLWCALVALVLGHSFAIEWTPRYLGGLVALSLSASVLAFYAYLTLLGRIGASRASYSTVMFPVFALAISTVVEAYVWNPLAIVGAALALGGNWLVLRGR